MYKLILVICLLTVGVKQTGAQGKFRFRSISQVGLLVGQSRPAFQLQTINGLAYKGCTVGVGVGMDNYYFKTIPVFMDVRKNFLAKKNSPFVYADLGWSIPQDREVIVNSWQKSDYASGLYYDLGVGYASSLWKAVGLTVSIGYSKKELKEERTYGPFDPAEPAREFYDYSFKRLSLKLGFSLW